MAQLFIKQDINLGYTFRADVRISLFSFFAHFILMLLAYHCNTSFLSNSFFQVFQKYLELFGKYLFFQIIRRVLVQQSDMFCLSIHESQGTMTSPATGQNNSYIDSFYSSLNIKENRNFFMLFCLFRYCFTKGKEICKIKFPLFVRPNLKILNVVVVTKMDITL